MIGPRRTAPDRGNPQGSMWIDGLQAREATRRLVDGLPMAPRQRMTHLLLPGPVVNGGPQPHARAGYLLGVTLAAGQQPMPSFAARLRGIRRAG